MLKCKKAKFDVFIIYTISLVSIHIFLNIFCGISSNHLNTVTVFVKSFYILLTYMTKRSANS